MKIAVAHLKSVSPYSQSAAYLTPKTDKESAADYEKRTWRDRIHATEDGYVFIPPMAFKNAMTEIASFLGMKIPGKRNATYTKHFTAGVLVVEPLVLNVKKADVVGEWLFVPASGKRGDGCRVWKCFSVIPDWEGDVVFNIFDETITEDVFLEHLKEAGKFVGIGRFRPAKNGFYGRFSVERMSWE